MRYGVQYSVASTKIAHEALTKALKEITASKDISQQVQRDHRRKTKTPQDCSMPGDIAQTQAQHVTQRLQHQGEKGQPVL